MADNELLREALLELHHLREREARVLASSQTLIDCLEAYSKTSSAGEALASIFVSFEKKFGAALTVLVAPHNEPKLKILASSTKSLIESVLSLPFDPFSRTRNISDLTVFDTLPDVLKIYTSAIVVPVRSDLAVLTFKQAGHHFQKTEVDLVQRLSGLAAQALRDSELAERNDLLAATISRSSSGVAIADAQDPKFPLVYVNTAFEQLSGFMANEVLGQNCRFLSAEPENSPERARLRKAVGDKTSGRFLLRNRRKSGELFWNELTLFPVEDASGQVKNLVATQTDVSERIRASEDRDRIRGWMESALKATEDAFLVLDKDDNVALANQSVADLFPAGDLGWAIGTQFRQNWDEYLKSCKDFPGRTTSLLKSADLAQLADIPSGIELDLPDGRSALVRVNGLQDGGKVLSATDVTAMRSAQSLLTQRLSAIEAASNGIATSDQTGRLTFVNSAAATLMGFASSNAALGRKWQQQYLQEDRPTRSGVLVQMRRQTPEGQTVTHEVSITDLNAGGAVIIIRDDTDRLALEEREDQLRQDLVRLQRQEAIAQLTAGVAHDFNNLLSVINGSATLAELDKTVSPSIRPHLKRILTAGNQSSKLISRLLDVGAGEDTESAFALSSVLGDLPDMVGPSLGKDQTFEITSESFDTFLQGNPNSLSQILINLVLNARDAFSGGAGKIRLDVTRPNVDPDAPIVVGELKAHQDYAQLSVTDNGAGIDAQTAASIFEPYFTTKARKGTGLGLATAAMQIRTIGGAVGLKTRVGQGTTFSIFWPLVRQQEVFEAKDDASKQDLSGMTVLVVDDDTEVNSVVSTYLELQGAEVAQCIDPRDAFEAIEDDPQAWSALVTDYDMPAMSGGALVAKVRSVAEHLPIIVVTAMAKRLSDPRLSEGQVTDILAKPVPLRKLSLELAKLKRNN